jgi:hypothetical protein
VCTDALLGVWNCPPSPCLDAELLCKPCCITVLHNIMGCVVAREQQLVLVAMGVNPSAGGVVSCQPGGLLAVLAAMECDQKASLVKRCLPACCAHAQLQSPGQRCHWQGQEAGASVHWVWRKKRSISRQALGEGFAVHIMPAGRNS